MKYLIAIMSLLLFSCTSVDNLRKPITSQRTYSFTKNFGEGLVGVTKLQARETFRRAARAWSSVCGLEFTESKWPSNVIVGERGLKDGMLGVAYYSAGLVMLDNSDRVWNEKLLFKTSLHEIGHAIGLPHIMHKRSIMYPYISKAERLSSFDIKRAKLIYGDSK